MAQITDSELIYQGFLALSRAVGPVGAERFIVLNNREPRDYTEWRKANLFVDESVRETAERARRDAARFRKLRETAMSDDLAATTTPAQ